MLRDDRIEEMLRRSNPEPDAAALRQDPLHAQRVISSIVRRGYVMNTSMLRSRPRKNVPQRTGEGLSGWRRAATVAVAAAAITLVTVGGIALLAPGGDVSPRDEAVLAPVASGGAASLVDGHWERSVIDDLRPSVRFEDLEATSHGLVAAATMDGIWMSDDGTTWRQVLAVPYEPSAVAPEIPTPPATVPPQPGRVETFVRMVEEFDGVLFATGIIATGQDGSGELEGRFLVWRSDDGVVWDEIVLESAVGDFPAQPGAMLVDDDALLIFADDGSIHRSDDGRSFTRYGPDETGTGAAFPAVAQLGDRLVAYGETQQGDDVARSIYTSYDGISWTGVPGSEFPPGHHPWGPMVEYRGALYLGGLTFLDDAAGAVWRSVDGESFELVDLGVQAPLGSSDDPDLTSMYGVQDLVVTPHGLLVIGHVPGELGNHDDMVVLASEDGVTFEVVPDPDGVFDDAVQSASALLDGRVVMVGYEPTLDAGDEVGIVWVWRP